MMGLILDRFMFYRVQILRAFAMQRKFTKSPSWHSLNKSMVKDPIRLTIRPIGLLSYYNTFYDQ
jgi:hypothetical protein